MSKLLSYLYILSLREKKKRQTERHSEIPEIVINMYIIEVTTFLSHPKQIVLSNQELSFFFSYYLISKIIERKKKRKKEKESSIETFRKKKEKKK